MTRLALLLLAGLQVDPLLAGHPVALRGHTGSVTALEFSQDGQTLASGGADRTARLWSLDGGAQQAVFADAGLVSALSLSTDGGRLAVGDAASMVRVFDTRTGALVRSVSTSEVVTSVALSPDGRRLALGGNVDHAAVYAVDDGKRLATLQGRSLAWSRDGKVLASGSRQPHLTLWDGVTLRKVREVSTAPASPQVVVDARGAVLVTWEIEKPGVRLFDGAGTLVTEILVAGAREAPAARPPPAAAPAAASPERAGGPARAPRQPAGRAPPADLPAAAVRQPPEPGVVSAAVSSDGRRVAVATTDLAVRVWDVAPQKVLARFPLDGPGFVALSPDGRWLAVGDGALVKLWALPAGGSAALK